ncbi:hypothetical protein [Nonomuraea solani]|nr:hypothetical protein [Nonomuraea solani]
MPHGDDLDQRFNELVAQIDAEERRKMRAAAKKGAKTRGAERSPGFGHDARLGMPSERAPRRIGRAWPAVAGITAVIAAAGAVITLRPDLLPAVAGPVPEETMPVVAAPVPLKSLTSPVSTEPLGPFEGSKAESWAEGAAGFDLPEAKAIGGLSKQDVAKGLKRTHKLLAAAFLDRKTILGGRPTAYMDLLHPEARSRFRKSLDRKDSLRGMLTSFAPKTAELVGDVIKVNGRAKLSSYKKDGITGAKVEINYLVAYAIQRPGQPATMTRLVTHNRGTMLMYREGGELVTWVRELGGTATPARCDVDDGYIHPFYDDSAPSKVRPEGPPQDPYDLDAPEFDGECGASEET